MRMSDIIYRVTEFVGTSADTVNDAIRRAVPRTSVTMEQHLDWFEVIETRGPIEDGAVAHIQVTLEVGLKLI